MRRNSKPMMLVVVVLALVASACQVGVSMYTPCAASPDGDPTGTDGTYVLFCRDGQWVPLMTVDEYLRIRRGEWVILAPVPAPPPERLTMTMTVNTDVSMGASKTEVALQGEPACDVAVVEDGLKYRTPPAVQWDDTRLPSEPWMLLAGSHLKFTVRNRAECWQESTLGFFADGAPIHGPAYWLHVPYDGVFGSRIPPVHQSDPWHFFDEGSRETTLATLNGGISVAVS